MPSVSPSLKFLQLRVLELSLIKINGFLVRSIYHPFRSSTLGHISPIFSISLNYNRWYHHLRTVDCLCSSSFCTIFQLPSAFLFRRSFLQKKHKNMLKLLQKGSRHTQFLCKKHWKQRKTTVHQQPMWILKTTPSPFCPTGCFYSTVVKQKLMQLEYGY